MKSLISKLKNWREHSAFRYMPRIADWAAWAATYRTRAVLGKTEKITLLLDSNLHSHAVTHESDWIDTGTVLWGGVQPVSTGYMARRPIHAIGNKSDQYADICYLTGLSYLARKGIVDFKTSSELMSERDRQPPARFESVEISSFSLFDRVDIQSLDGRNFESLLGLPSVDQFLHNRPNKTQAQHQYDRVNSYTDPLFQKLLTILASKKHSLDALHIATAERHGCSVFLTMDYSLLRLLENKRKQIDKLELNVQVCSPSQLGKKFRMKRVAPHLFSYNDASFPVRADLHAPNETRRSTRKKNVK